jgi:UDP-2,4-diacetamido-2,4,6-trideoxy-beta-L-altropyranose hydrolase
MSAIQRIAIRADASAAIGMGHLTRCMSLANLLGDDGVAVVFLLRSHAAAFVPTLEAAGYAVRLLPDPEERDATATTWLSTSWQRDAEQTRQALGEIGPVDWLIVDHYGLDARWERMQRQLARHVLVIDDIANRAHACDMLLDQNLALNMGRYEGLVPPNCQTLLGPHYALLRPEFAHARKSLSNRKGEVHRLLVCFGGSDSSNETAKVLVAVKNLPDASLGIDVVIGVSNPNTHSVAALCQELPHTTLHRSAGNMAELMARADLAIGAGGVMCWERCCLGLPAIAVDIADNQVGALTALAAIGALDYVGSAASVTAEQITRAIRALLDAPATVRAMGDIARDLVDGQGSARVYSEMRLLASGGA